MKNITETNIKAMSELEAKGLLFKIREDAISTSLEDSRDCNEFAEKMKEIFPEDEDNNTIIIEECTVEKLISELQKYNSEIKVEVADCSLDRSSDKVNIDYYEHDNSLDIYSDT